ncbi:hypothetical protein EJ05DRAFT_246982 [Pseudovirgaria hyperparasitica]|uniref:Uncharacterized protein n=1 Tax=Pseudovirgaria hyperparasitica TaxID=470096 RepID=A0A6A6WDN5_9PEZI|nr:uncharacterized protein EJ05DRAFT_246982 [Pseudovirgaria hyperparasitica]KAF2760938.1 hypothetical protein EJ05DRAFT_246982 [Pseudovirgaria hyperparasitica]
MLFAPRTVRRKPASSALHTSARQAFKLWKLFASGAQLPLSQRQSQQLLDTLKNSFRSHLDREHPPSASEPTHPVFSHPALPAPASKRSSATNSRSVTDGHLHSILNNPLFAVKPTQESIPSLVNDPLGWFRGQVALGAATVPKAVACLDTLQAKGYLIPDGSGDNKAKRHLVGSLVLDWINISGLDTSREYMKSQELSALLTRFVYAEDREDVIMDWLGLPSSVAVKCEFNVAEFHLWKLRVMITYLKLNLAINADSGLIAFLRSWDVLKLHDPTNRYTRKKAALFLIKYLVSQPEGKPLKCSPTLYEDIITQTPGLLGRAPFFEAFLWLHHPTNPKTSFATELISRKYDETLKVHGHQRPPGKVGESIDWLEIFYYDLMQRLLEEGREVEAVQVLGKAQLYKKKASATPSAVTPTSTSIRSRYKTVDSKGEAESLGYLNDLGLT